MVERAEMLPAPEALYDVPLWLDEAKFTRTTTSRSRRRSTPCRTASFERTFADRKLVKIYFGTELIKVPERQQPGGRSTDPKDYPADKAVYAPRDVDALRTRAKQKGIHVGAYVDRLHVGPLPWRCARARSPSTS